MHSCNEMENFSANGVCQSFCHFFPACHRCFLSCFTKTGINQQRRKTFSPPGKEYKAKSVHSRCKRKSICYQLTTPHGDFILQVYYQCLCRHIRIKAGGKLASKCQGQEVQKLKLNKSQLARTSESKIFRRMSLLLPISTMQASFLAVTPQQCTPTFCFIAFTSGERLTMLSFKLKGGMSGLAF